MMKNPEPICTFYNSCYCTYLYDYKEGAPEEKREAVS